MYQLPSGNLGNSNSYLNVTPNSEVAVPVILRPETGWGSNVPRRRSSVFTAGEGVGCCAETDKFLAEIPEVLEVHDVAGEDSYFLKVRVKNTEHLSRLLRERLKNVPNVASTKTTIVLQTIKETTALPIADSEEKTK